MWEKTIQTMKGSCRKYRIVSLFRGQPGLRGFDPQPYDTILVDHPSFVLMEIYTSEDRVAPVGTTPRMLLVLTSHDSTYLALHEPTLL